MRPFNLLIAFSLATLCCSSCKVLHVIHLMHQKGARIVEMKSNNKTVEFIPMHHVGKKEFYDEVRDIVQAFKQDGFIVYFESSRMEPMKDSVALDGYERKFRRMLGLYLDTNGYVHYLHDKGLFKKMVDQPKYRDLGVTGSDLRVDIPKNKLVDAYENKYGKIELYQVDTATPLTGKYNTRLKLPKKKVRDIIINYRNQHLADYIQNSKDKKIIVIYGEDHLEGVFEDLKKTDHSWKKK